MNYQRRHYLVIGLFVLALMIFTLNFSLTHQAKTKIYQYFFCDSCPHQDLEDQLQLWEQKIAEFHRTYPDIDSQILNKKLQNEECWRKLNSNRLDSAKQELESCNKALQQIIKELAQFNDQHENMGQGLEPDLDNFEDILLD